MKTKSKFKGHNGRFNNKRNKLQKFTESNNGVECQYSSDKVSASYFHDDKYQAEETNYKDGDINTMLQKSKGIQIRNKKKCTKEFVLNL